MMSVRETTVPLFPSDTSARLRVTLACLSAVLGIYAVYGTSYSLLHIWRTDDLRSMGAVIPWISAALILRSWRELGWSGPGSWWGFFVLTAAAVLVFVKTQLLFVVLINRSWAPQIPPLSLIAVAYAAGLVILFGGTSLLKRAWFGVALMALVIPVPRLFSERVDLPLQRTSALVARGFAHALGEQLTQDKLRLMFTPEFGMFIAPGCNGVRGAITLGLAALIISYLYRFRWFLYFPVVMGSVLLGYLFNFLRLCLLVLYYEIALPYPWLQQRAKTADFIIGGTLFLFALILFFTVANRLRNNPRDVKPTPLETPLVRNTPVAPVILRFAAVFCLAAVFGMDAYNAHRADARVSGNFLEGVSTPQQLGPYVLLKRWTDKLPGGPVVYDWAAYAIPGMADSNIALGVSPILDIHDVEICHLIRGEDPTYRGQLRVMTSGGAADMTFATYNNGTMRWLEASTVCDVAKCEQSSRGSAGVTLSYSKLHRVLPLQSDPVRPVPILVRVESSDLQSPEAVARPILISRMENFLATFNLHEITRPYSRRTDQP